MLRRRLSWQYHPQAVSDLAELRRRSQETRWEHPRMIIIVENEHPSHEISKILLGERRLRIQGDHSLALWRSQR